MPVLRNTMENKKDRTYIIVAIILQNIFLFSFLLLRMIFPESSMLEQVTTILFLILNTITLLTVIISSLKKEPLTMRKIIILTALILISILQWRILHSL